MNRTIHENIDSLLASSRRLYLHVKVGGKITERDVARLVEGLEEIQSLAQDMEVALKCNAGLLSAFVGPDDAYGQGILSLAKDVIGSEAK